MMNLDTIKMQAATASLNQMFAQRYFCIVTIRTIYTMLYDAEPRGEEWRILRSLHCVEYSTMNDELRAELPRLIATVLAIPPFCVATFTTVETTPVVKVQPRKSFFDKILNTSN